MDEPRGPETYVQALMRPDKTRTLMEHSEQQADEIAPHMPEAVSAIVDIGCGTGLVAAFLGLRHEGSIVHLIDGGEAQPRGRTGWRKKMAPYNSVHRAVERASKVLESDRLMGHVADPVWKEPIPAEFIMSLQSWCHHFPARTYLDFVDKSLSETGRVVLDLRRREEKASLKQLRAVLAPVDVIRERLKSRRFVFHRA